MTELKRGLKSRHIQLIALGGAIGTGLFLGIAQTIKMAGPSVLLGYALAGFIAFLIMRQLGEMVVDDLELVLRGLPPQRCQRAVLETVTRFRSKPVG